jgi:hypothetical protein
MNIDEFRNALRGLLNDAVKGGLGIDDILSAVDAELHPACDLDDLLAGVTQENVHGET